jgi:glycosyltransferase involved in cell wall biosynthesis
VIYKGDLQWWEVINVQTKLNILTKMEQTKIKLYQRCHAFIHPQVEDFGIAAVEAMAAGKPVIAYKHGGAQETVVHGQTGIHLDAQSWQDIAGAVQHFDEYRFDPTAIRAHAERFSHARFLQDMRVFIDDACKTHGLCAV